MTLIMTIYCGNRVTLSRLACLHNSEKKNSVRKDGDVD